MSGRPSHYTGDIAQQLLDELVAGRSLEAICHDDGMPPRRTVRTWVTDDRENFAARYREARKRAKTAVKAGRPPVFTAECAERILAQLASGRTVADICADPGMPAPGTVWQWIVADRDDFAARYRRAREIGQGRTGRHTLYTADLANWILDQLGDGRTLADVCRDPGMPSRATVLLWVEENREGFEARYMAARKRGCHAMADQMVEIADDALGDWVVLRNADGSTETLINPQHIHRCKLRINTRNWLLSRVLPQHYGNRPDTSAQEAEDKYKRNLAEMMKLIDGKTRGLPSEDIPLDGDDPA